MAIKTTLEQLEEVQAAISKVMKGQSVSMDGNQLTRANLADLEKREEKLLARYRNESGQGGPTFNRGLKGRG